MQGGGVGGGRKRTNEKMGLGGRQTIKDSISKNRLRVAGGRGSGEGDGEMDIGEGMCYDECCEMCKPGDSQTCTPGDKNTFYVY